MKKSSPLPAPPFLTLPFHQRELHIIFSSTTSYRIFLTPLDYVPELWQQVFNLHHKKYYFYVIGSTGPPCKTFVYSSELFAKCLQGKVYK